MDMDFARRNSIPFYSSFISFKISRLIALDADPSSLQSTSSWIYLPRYSYTSQTIYKLEREDLHFVILCIFDDIQRQGLIYIDHFIFFVVLFYLITFYNLYFCIENQRLYRVYIYIV